MTESDCAGWVVWKQSGHGVRKGAAVGREGPQKGGRGVTPAGCLGIDRTVEAVVEAKGEPPGRDVAAEQIGRAPDRFRPGQLG